MEDKENKMVLTPVKITTEGSEIISSGSVIVPSNEYVQFEINGLRFRFSFIQESSEENAEVQISKNVETDQSGQQCLTIIISNLRNALFGTLKNSMQVATLDDRSLSVRFSIVSINSGDESVPEDKILFYTWYLTNVLKKED